MSKALTQLANRLRGIKFPDDTGFFDQAFFDRAIAHGPKSCYTLNNGNLWVVKFSLGGKVQCLGFTTHGADAARFSDMARVRFHPYRLRGGGQPLVDTDLNFDLAQVKVDETECPEAVALLDDIQHLLLAEGVIEDIKVVEAAREAAVKLAEVKLKVRQTRNTKGGEILLRLERIEKLVSSTEKLLAQFVALSQV